MKQPFDTIAAVATATGEAGVGIVRVSGPDALALANAFFTPASGKPPVAFEPLRLYYGTIKDSRTGRGVDNGYLVFMKAPRSYTGEDTIELQCHGGPLVIGKVLGAALASGARLAGPGEFTKRAFLNGRLDLSQAEAVCDLIRAKSESALRAARARAGGALAARVNRIKEALAGLLAVIEAGLDFPEEEIGGETGGDAGGFLTDLGQAAGDTRTLISSYEKGRALTEGVRALILGRPNVGKSSLLNALLREERAIVTPVPGTTRDLIEETVAVRGVPVRLMDTAGLCRTTDCVESIGVERAMERVAAAGLILFVVDASTGDFTEDLKTLESIAGDAVNKRLIVVANKIDLVEEHVLAGIAKRFAPWPAVFISALKEKGMDGLEDKIYEECTGGGGLGEREPGELITTARQKDALEKALEGMERAGQGLQKGTLTQELVATELRWALDCLGEITGETTPDDILERIFSGFCIGK